MDETIEKKVIEESSDFSILSLFLQADIVVKIVIVILIFFFHLVLGNNFFRSIHHLKTF